MGNNKECKSGTSSRARLVLDLQPILTESMSGEDRLLLAELSEEMLQNAGIEQHFHSDTISAGNIEVVLKFILSSQCV